MALVVTWRMVQHRMHLSFCKYCDLWFVCLCISLSVSPRVYIRNYTCDLPNIWSCCLRLWRDLPPTRGGKSAIYDCLVYVVLGRCVVYSIREWGHVTVTELAASTSSSWSTALTLTAQVCCDIIIIIIIIIINYHHHYHHYWYVPAAYTQGANHPIFVKTDMVCYKRLLYMVGFLRPPATTSGWTTFSTGYCNSEIQDSVQDGRHILKSQYYHWLLLYIYVQCIVSMVFEVRESIYDGFRVIWCDLKWSRMNDEWNIKEWMNDLSHLLGLKLHPTIWKVYQSVQSFNTSVHVNSWWYTINCHCRSHCCQMIIDSVSVRHLVSVRYSFTSNEIFDRRNFFISLQ